LAAAIGGVASAVDQAARLQALDGAAHLGRRHSEAAGQLGLIE
jgi:hypothetical protein